MATSTHRSIPTGCAGSSPRWAISRTCRALLVSLVLAAAACRTLAPPPEPAAVAPLIPRLGNLLLVGFHGTAGEGDAELERLLCETRAGGVLLFGRNVRTPEQVAGLTGWMAARAQACAGRPLLIGVDAEGGRVMRLGTSAGYTDTLSHRDSEVKAQRRAIACIA